MGDEGQLISTLADLPLDTLHVVRSFTPDHLIDLLEVLAENHRECRVKLIYLEEDERLLLTRSSYAHYAILESLDRIIRAFTNDIGHDNYIYNFNSYFNKQLFHVKTDGSYDEMVHDYQLFIQNNSGRAPGFPLTPKWVGEPTINLAFMIVIEESPTWMTPSSKDTNMQELRSQPLRTYPDFILPLPQDSLGPVVVEQFTWISITRITFELYLRRPDGSLLVDNRLQDNYSACGTLYPIEDMERVNALLGDASDHLRQSLITEMEASQCDAPLIERVRQSKAKLNIPWHAVKLSFRTVVLEAAYKRYMLWHMSGQSKLTSQPSSLEK